MKTATHTDGCSVATAQAIDASILHNSIVTIDYTPTLARELLEACDGDVLDAARGTHEYWGKVERDEYGELVKRDWRVHLRGVPSSQGGR